VSVRPSGGLDRHGVLPQGGHHVHTKARSGAGRFWRTMVRRWNGVACAFAVFARSIGLSYRVSTPARPSEQPGTPGDRRLCPVQVVPDVRQPGSRAASVQLELVFGWAPFASDRAGAWTRDTSSCAGFLKRPAMLWSFPPRTHLLATLARIAQKFRLVQSGVQQHAPVRSTSRPTLRGRKQTGIGSSLLYWTRKGCHRLQGLESAVVSFSPRAGGRGRPAAAVCRCWLTVVRSGQRQAIRSVIARLCRREEVRFHLRLRKVASRFCLTRVLSIFGPFSLHDWSMSLLTFVLEIVRIFYATILVQAGALICMSTARGPP